MGRKDKSLLNMFVECFWAGQSKRDEVERELHGRSARKGWGSFGLFVIIALDRVTKR